MSFFFFENSFRKTSIATQTNQEREIKINREDKTKQNESKDKLVVGID